MDKALLDTDIVSEVVKGRNATVARRAAEYVGEHGRLTTTCLTLMEIVKGYHKASRPERLTRALEVLGTFEIVDFGEEAAVFAGRVHGDLERAGKPLGRIDPMIAGIAPWLDVTLVTGNT